MPNRARTRCARCHRLKGPDGQCSPQCRKQLHARGERARGGSTAQGYGREHRELFRTPVLVRDPVCVACGSAPSMVADHHPLSRRELIAAGLDPNDPRYGRGLCKPCHDRSTAERQPGGWNRAGP